jgi:hypothetical protein
LVNRQREEGARTVALRRREANGGRVPSTIEEAYALRDRAGTLDERDYYQEHIYRLRAERYRSRGIRTKESVRKREQSKTEAVQAEDGDTRGR